MKSSRLLASVRIASVIFSLCLAAICAVAQSKPLNWKEYVSSQGKFSILLPGEPTTGYRPVGADSESSTTYVTNLIIDEKAWTVAYFDLPAAPADEAASQNRFDRTRDHMLKMYSVKLSKEDNLTFNGLPVRSFTTKPDDGNRIFHTRIYLIGQRVYQVWALARVGDEEAAGVKAYFDSFKAQPLNAQEVEAAATRSQNDEKNAKPRKIKVSSGVLIEQATKKVQPLTPAHLRAKGLVEIKITVSNEGDVISADAISGHLMLRVAALEAARQWKFKPMKLGNMPVMMEGVLPLEFK